MSTQSKAKARKDRREGIVRSKTGAEAENGTPSKSGDKDVEMTSEKKDKDGEKNEVEEDKAEEEEPSFAVLKNPSRVLRE